MPRMHLKGTAVKPVPTSRMWFFKITKIIYNSVTNELFGYYYVYYSVNFNCFNAGSLYLYTCHVNTTVERSYLILNVHYNYL